MDRQNNPYLGNYTNNNPPKDDNDHNSQQAADLVRAKLASLYDGSTTESAPDVAPAQSAAHPQQEPATSSPTQQSINPAPSFQNTPQHVKNDFQTFKIPRGKTPEHAPAIGTLYQREQTLQTQINHSPQTVQPDHQLQAAQPQYELPPPKTTTTPLSPRHELTLQPSQHAKQQAPITHQQPVVTHTPAEQNNSRPTVSQQINPAPQANTPVDRNQAIDRFIKQAEQTKSIKKDRLKFWKRNKIKQPKQKKNPMYRTALLTALVLVLYNNQLISGQINYYISPGDAVVSPQIIDPRMDNSVGPDPVIVIPKINVELPTVYGVETRNDDVIQEFLEEGIVHYARTALPGQVGNTVLLGHSSNSFWNGGQHKYAFSLLDRLEVGDTYMINFEGKRYVYEVFNKEVIEPTEFRVVSQETDGIPISTLITCTPPGTSWKRLVIQAEQISPDPLEAEEVEFEQTAEDQEILAGNTSSLWDNIRNWLFD